MTESFKIIDSDYYSIYKSISIISWALWLLLFLIIGPGSVLAFEILGKGLFIILTILFLILFVFNIFFKSKMLKLKRGTLTITKTQISTNWNDGKSQIFDNSQIANLKIKHGSTFKRLTTEADVEDGLDNYLEFEYEGKLYKIQFEINSLLENKNLLQVTNQLKDIFARVDYIKI